MNKIVVHWENGEIAKGYSLDFSSTCKSFHLKNQKDPLCSEEVDLCTLKAVFFVKDFLGDSLHEYSRDFRPVPAGIRHVEVSFCDGEKFFGYSDEIHTDCLGFFISPIDPDANTTRAFVLYSFIEGIDITE